MSLKFSTTFIALTLTCLFLLSCATTPKTVNSPNTFLTLDEAEQRFKQIEQVNYDLFFNLKREEKTYNGSSTISFNLKHKDHPIRIDFYKGQVSGVSQKGKALNFQYNDYYILVPANQLELGRNTIKVDFSHDFAKDGRGFSRFQDPSDKRVYTYTDLEPYKANRVFPCFDQPDLKATYKMSVQAPKKWFVITSVRESETKDIENNQVLWVFPESAKFSTYIWSLHAGDYAVWKDMAGDVPLRLFARQSLAKYVKPAEWFKYTKEGFKYINKYFDYPYPYKKYDQILVPEYNHGAMENVAAVTFNERFISRGEKSELLKIRLAETLLHEMAHMWFGNLVTMKWWDDLWLNESFATFFSFYVLSEATEHNASSWKYFRRMKDWAYWEDQLVTTHPIVTDVKNTKQALANFDGITYGKGAAALKQLAYYVGPKKFQKGMQIYFKRHAEGNTKLRDFMKALEDGSQIPLKDWQQKWLQTSGVNTIKVDIQCKGDVVDYLKLIQTYPKDHPVIRPHKVQVAFLDKVKKKFKVTKTFEVKIDSTETDVVAAKGQTCPKLVHPNNGDHGFLKVNLDRPTVENLFRGISSVESPLLRIQFWAALWDMVRDGKLNIYTYANVFTKNIEAEKDSTVLRWVMQTAHGRWPNSPSILFYLPNTTTVEKMKAKEFRTQLEDIVWNKLKKAQPGSESQKAWFESFYKSATTTKAFARIESLLDSKTRLQKFKLDQDKRWDLVLRLSMFGHKGAKKRIQSESKKDPSSQGIKSRIASEVAFPDWNEKQKWLNEIKSDNTKYSFDQLRVAIYNMFPPNQMKLRDKYAHAFFKDLDQLKSKKEGYYLQTFANLAPIECEEKKESKIASYLKSAEDAHPSLMKSLKISNQENQRCQKIKAVAKIPPGR